MNEDHHFSFRVPYMINSVTLRLVPRAPHLPNAEVLEGFAVVQPHERRRIFHRELTPKHDGFDYLFSLDCDLDAVG